LPKGQEPLEVELEMALDLIQKKLERDKKRGKGKKNK
jgi:topoisomerase IA-like protein